jgi:N-acetylglucosaminyl-diphospho-decaprenol L-rhamnosyltransferase
VAAVDVVVVSHNSSATLPGCVGPLAGQDSLNVIVVDNASQDASLAMVSDLPVTLLDLDRNRGFAYGCNRGSEAGSAPFVLFLNPDARLDPESVLQLARVLETHPSIGLVAPRLVDEDGSLDFSQRWFPRLRSTYAQALFLHRLFPRAGWTDEVVRDPVAYEHAHPVDWVSGACVLVRREALKRLDGWDEGFFLYSEDKDICRRLWSFGYEVRYDPLVTAVHIGGASAPRADLLPVLARSRVRYARKHAGRPAAFLERLGVALGSLTHAALTTKGRPARAGYLQALRVSLFPGSQDASRSARTESVPTVVEGRGASH